MATSWRVTTNDRSGIDRRFCAKVRQMSEPGARCFGEGDVLYSAYHDTEWGRPVHGDQELFERLVLEGFQSGLSWLTVLRKRSNFREAFANFDAHRISAFTTDDVDRLMLDAGIIRNRRKIEATVANAQALTRLHADHGSLDELFWSHAPAPRAHQPASFAAVPTTTPESLALSKALKAVGFTFIGPTTAYAAMQACGLVNDHLATCPAMTGGTPALADPRDTLS